MMMMLLMMITMMMMLPLTQAVCLYPGYTGRCTEGATRITAGPGDLGPECQPATTRNPPHTPSDPEV